MEGLKSLVLPNKKAIRGRNVFKVIKTMSFETKLTLAF